MAARTYFDKSAGELDVLESATLIGMLKGTSYYNPVLNPERARERRNVVLAQMVKRGKLDAGAGAGACSSGRCGSTSSGSTEPVGPAPHLAQQLRKWLIAWADRNGYDIYSDGLVVRTTIDSRLQKRGQPGRGAAARAAAAARGPRAARRSEDRPLLQAGFLALDPRNGHVRAWVGSRDFAKDQFDHVQPGAPPARLDLQALRLRRGVRGRACGRPTRFIDQPVAHPDAGRRRLEPARCDAAERPADDAARRPGVLEEHASPRR